MYHLELCHGLELRQTLSPERLSLLRRTLSPEQLSLLRQTLSPEQLSLLKGYDWGPRRERAESQKKNGLGQRGL